MESLREVPGMRWLNIDVSVLGNEAYASATPEQQATWFGLICYCAQQENWGIIPESCKDWTDRIWLVSIGKTKADIEQVSPLWKRGEDDKLFVNLYPEDQQAEYERKKLVAMKAGKAKSEAKTAAAQINGQKGGRPVKQYHLRALPD